MLSIVITIVDKIFIRDNEREEAAAALTLAASVAAQNAARTLALETLARELSVSEKALADSPRSRRNAAKRGRKNWLDAAFGAAPFAGRKTSAARYADVEASVDRDAIKKRALEALDDDALTDVVFDAETGRRCYSRRRVAETTGALVAEAARIHRALARVGALDEPSATETPASAKEPVAALRAELAELEKRRDYVWRAAGPYPSECDFSALRTMEERAAEIRASIQEIEASHREEGKHA